MAREQLQTLSEPMYFVLLALMTPRHGYEVMQEVQEMSHGQVKVGAGTLYSLLARFEESAFIAQVSHDGRRKTYELTPRGYQLLLREHQRLKLLVAAGDKLFATE